MRPLLITCLMLLAIAVSADEPSHWKIEDGWLLRSRDGGDHFERFFAVVIWGAPGWQGISDGDSSVQDRLAEALDHFNVIHTRAVDLPDIDRYLAPRHRDTVFMVGYTALDWKMRSTATGGGYSASLPLSFESRSGRPDYAGVQMILSDLESGDSIKSYMETIVRGARRQIDTTWADGRGLETIWCLADEPDINYGGWYWPPELITTYRRTVEQLLPDFTPTFVGFSAMTGNIYTFDHLLTSGEGERWRGPLPQHISELPATFPADSLAGWTGEPEQYTGYLFMADGLPVNYPGDRGRRPWGQLRPRMAETLRLTAGGYAHSGTIFGLNRYPAFEVYPDLAGECVDEIQTACGDDTPVWLYFDGMGRDGDRGYWSNIRCQVFTSLIHGASGVQFWQSADMNKNPSPFWWDRMTALADELLGLESALTARTVRRGVTDEGVHFAVFEPAGGGPLLLASNPHHKDIRELVLPGLYAGSLAPLAVVVRTLF